MTVKNSAEQSTSNWWQSKSKDFLYSFLRTSYEGRGNPTRAWLHDHLRGRVLDCGCGAGVDYEYLQNVCDYTGMDVTPKMIELCRERFPEGQWIEGSIEAIPFEDQSFDVVYCRHVLEHLKDYRRAVNELRRVGKQVVIVLFHKIAETSQVVSIGHGTFNNYYDAGLLTHLGVHRRYEIGSQQILVWPES